ncbi:J1 / DnaJ domain-containing protein / JDP1 [Leishmania donovani]|uniref:Chaperone_protein_DNAj_-_putative n=3 Tax=Leishmania donovani species complex TaxID=38574 RepID=A0A6L0XS93_LEIIN|nr:putative chaperone protein DNAj [Leishmania infantum JPCM5]XP_003863733.1 chaperone protein DNAj, putative [Leishmania donovani]CAC9527405.1 chaperone_protein_DNAj_-_putative [Leishmania infantum]AYU81873.1 chaperone protein DNAj, putative [Leishmania donovani]TPP43829.1 DnaJ domain family protein [Leishmania donovani]TPP47327.1 DnaJ domain family protein [Leishmania donovani]CAJ1991858.1 J1 / DnaJ domain-containing protein / JDP1 [Leishmania donovani]|eukprot:XP_001467996.1 putative chaperone protein DNAj [Leishmania infantum JPCM5]
MSDDSVYALRGTSALYEVLGVSRNATQREIRQGYYRLAVLYHPDKNPEGSDVFKEVCFAHGILSDPEQRALYDSGTLRAELESRARACCPSMDPGVELSPEDLRVFVDRVRQTQEANRQVQSTFELRREEEMKRRAEFDAKNPAFKSEYEQARRRRHHACGGSTSAAHAHASATVDLSKTVPPKVRTSAEVLAELQREEEERLYGNPGIGPANSSSGKVAVSDGLSTKHHMLSHYRAAHSEASGAESLSSFYSGGSASATLRRRQLQTTSLPFVRAHCEKPQYSETISATVQAYANYDYLTFVEGGSMDHGELEGAIMADALGNYDRHH